MKRLSYIAALLCLLCTPALAKEAKKSVDPKNTKNMTCPRLNDAAAYEKGLSGFKFLIPGKDGFIFRSTDFKQDFALDETSQASIHRMVNLLKAKGISLVMLIQPTRGIMARNLIDPAETHAADFKPEAALGSYRANIETLKKLGVITTDLTGGPQGSDYFSLRDIHWTRDGANDSAQKIAEEIKKAGLLDGIRKEEYVTTKGETGTFQGGLAEAVEKICKNKLPEEDFVQYETTKKNADSDALFADEAPKIVLAGTSNGTVKRANLEGAFKEHLGVDVLNVSVGGGGPDTAILDYLSSDAYRKNPPKVLIWEVPGHYSLNSKALHAQILPSIPTECKNPVGAKELTVSGPTDLTMTTKQTDISGEVGYIKIQVKGKMPESFKGRAVYGTKRGPAVEMIASDRMEKNVLLMEFDSRPGRFPTKFVFEAPVKTTVDLQFCSY
jgi:alginate biosynthesis protein AlgX